MRKISYENSKTFNRNKTKKWCTTATITKRLPFLQWLPKYTVGMFIQDTIAGITVGLTAIPQGIAYAVIAGLSPEYGLYSSLTTGFVYFLFGSCRDVTIGPTAILASMVAKYVTAYTDDFAVLAAFLCGVVELLMGVFRLGFLIDFISAPVISGFTTAAALQIAVAQLKSLFGLAGKSGNYFAESVYNVALNIKTARLWDPVLGFGTILTLALLKRLGEGCKRTDRCGKQIRWFISLSRNAIVVIMGMIIAFTIKISSGKEPVILIGDIGSGVPVPKPPPFSTVVGNETLQFSEMLTILGPSSIVLPLVAILELVAIAKAFSGGAVVDATQELIAIGFCNIIGSFFGSMPTTGSFTRTALNSASGVQTTGGGITKSIVILLALSLLTTTFYFIPKASLAGLIITAMYYMIDIKIIGQLWKTSKREFFVLITTIVFCLCFGLEYGIAAGVIIEASILMYRTARPPLDILEVTGDKGDFIVLRLNDNVPYCAAEHVRSLVLKSSINVSVNTVVILDGTNLNRIDSTVAFNFVSLVSDLEQTCRQITFLNFTPSLEKLCTDLSPKLRSKFIKASSTDELICILTYEPLVLNT